MELYAGAANVWRAVSRSYPAVRADLTYASSSQPELKQNPMDVLTSSGFAMPSCILSQCGNFPIFHCPWASKNKSVCLRSMGL